MEKGSATRKRFRSTALLYILNKNCKTKHLKIKPSSGELINSSIKIVNKSSKQTGRSAPRLPPLRVRDLSLGPLLLAQVGAALQLLQLPHHVLVLQRPGHHERVDYDVLRVVLRRLRLLGRLLRGRGLLVFGAFEMFGGYFYIGWFVLVLV